MAGLSVCKCAAATGVPRATISDYGKRFEITPCMIEEALDKDEKELEKPLFPEKQVQRSDPQRF